MRNLWRSRRQKRVDSQRGQSRVAIRDVANRLGDGTDRHVAGLDLGTALQSKPPDGEVNIVHRDPDLAQRLAQEEGVVKEGLRDVGGVAVRDGGIRAELKRDEARDPTRRELVVRLDFEELVEIHLRKP